PRRVLLDLDDALDLDGNSHRERAHADRGARVPAALAEDLDEEIRAAVDDFRLVLEVGHRVYHAEHLDDALHAVEAAELGAHHGEQVEPHAAGVLVALLDAEFAAHLALRQLSVLAGARTLAGEKQEIAGAYRVHIVCYRRRDLAELDAELRETLFGAHEETT